MICFADGQVDCLGIGRRTRSFSSLFISSTTAVGTAVNIRCVSNNVKKTCVVGIQEMKEGLLGLNAALSGKPSAKRRAL